MTFKIGDPGGPGRPKKATEIRFLERLTCRVTEDRWDKIIDTAIEFAEKGDAVARAWLGKHLMGDDPLGFHETMEEVAAMRQELQEIRNAKLSQGTPGVHSGDAGGASYPPASNPSQ